MHRAVRPRALSSAASRAHRASTISSALALALALALAPCNITARRLSSRMNSAEASHQPDASGAAPKQLGHVPNLKLNDGNEIPMLAYGLGTANYKTGPNKHVIDEKIIADTVAAIRAGYRHLDGADGYGNEAELGEAIRRAGVPRDRLYVVTKCSAVPPPGTPIGACLDASLARLGLDHVDLYLIHAPFFAYEGGRAGDDAAAAAELRARWAEMEAVRASGRARSVGVSNYLPAHLDATLAGARVPPAVNQVEYHPYLQHDPGFLAYHRERGIAVSAYAPLTALTRARPGPVDGTYAALARKYGVEEGDVALRWVLDQGAVVVTTSSREERLRGFLARVPSFKLTPAEVDEIAARGREKHFRAFWKHKFDENDRS